MEGKEDAKEGPKKHTVEVKVVGRTISYNKPQIRAERGDTIEWVINDEIQFAVVVRARHSPLAWACHVAPRGGKPLEVKVRQDAMPGVYPYALCVCVRDTLVIDDPEIIIPLPRGRG
ncbi:MAG: hypothetical protein ACXWHJ_10750 [Candidatus Aminicenantales bacterium]